MSDQPATIGAPEETFERWERLSALLEAALALPDEERPAFARRECGGDALLIRELESLLEAHGVGQGPIEAMADALGAALGAADAAGAAGRRIGPYAILRELGRGGMGVVYLARRIDGQYVRDVALKVMQNPVFDAPLRDRFLAEREILASLSHPNIASLFDGGVTGEGHPYFTMELVEGQPIDAYCDAKQLDVRARVTLFRQVCAAVAAAHRSLVVHRDLKPSNVLVDGAGQVKLLDFGIAKLLDPPRHGLEPTQPAARVFTRDYASPEQVRGESVTTASDVYSLGVLLYRLLTSLPAHRFDSDSPAAIEKVVCETEPLRPSAAIRAAMREPRSPRLEAVCRARRTRPERLRRALAGDLDTIVMRALGKDPARRYASVDLLDEDLDRYLTQRPVAARPDSAAYRAGKFIRRHRMAVGAAALVALALAGGALATFIQAERANAAAARAQRVSTLVTELFALAEPGRTRGGTITARELLDQGTARIAAELGDDPEAQAAMYGVVGRLYRNLALAEPAEQALERAVALRRETSGPGSLEYADALHALADLRDEHSDYRAAEGLFREALAVRRAAGAPARDVALALEGLGRALSGAGRHDDAEAPLIEALAIQQRLGAPAPERIQTLHELALAYLRQGKGAEGRPLFQQAVELGRTLPKASASLRVSSLVNLARHFRQFERKPAEAEALYREALDVARRWYPAGHPEIATCLGELAGTVRDQGRLAEAEPLAAETLDMLQGAYGAEHRESIVAKQRLASIVAGRGRSGEAESLYRETLDASRAVFGDGHPLTLSAESELAEMLLARGRHAEAESLLSASLASARRVHGDSDVYAARAWAALGSLHAATGAPSRAEPELRRALEIRRTIHAAGHWRIAEAEAALGGVLARLGRRAEAEALLVSAAAALAKSTAAPPHALERTRQQLAALRRGEPAPAVHQPERRPGGP